MDACLPVGQPVEQTTCNQWGRIHKGMSNACVEGAPGVTEQQAARVAAFAQRVEECCVVIGRFLLLIPLLGSVIYPHPS